MSKPNNLIGKKFGKLTVISRSKNSKGGKCMWNCVCDCGKLKSKPVSSYDLTSGKVRSCGCLYNGQKNSTKHGLKNTRLYCVWSGMIQRCENKKTREYHNYGGRGISICKEWRNDFSKFYDWAIENGYDPDAKRGECTIDRINTNGNYCPENCRFVSMLVQQNNRRNNRIITIFGQGKTAKEWSELSDLKSATIMYRANNNWPDKDMLIPARLNNRIERKKNNAE